jgi:hypothetical protein
MPNSARGWSTHHGMASPALETGAGEQVLRRTCLSGLPLWPLLPALSVGNRPNCWLCQLLQLVSSVIALGCLDGCVLLVGSRQMILRGYESVTVVRPLLATS